MGAPFSCNPNRDSLAILNDIYTKVTYRETYTLCSTSFFMKLLAINVNIISATIDKILEHYILCILCCLCLARLMSHYIHQCFLKLEQFKVYYIDDKFHFSNDSHYHEGYPIDVYFIMSIVRYKH